MNTKSILPLLAMLCHCAASHAGTTLYVSKLGDNSSGASWAKAFHSIQAALDAIPDDKGGHRVIVRPDTYIEANLSVAYPGAEGAYNELIADYDGRFGSGVTGMAVIDSGDPDRGFKSYDWWGTLRATTQGWSKEHNAPTFSAICWDRWQLRHLYATGGDGGFMWDCTDRIEPFTVIVEDCVSIGRAFGGGAASCLSRPEEPITFRRCTLWALDWWGDTAAAYVRIENPAMPDATDVLFEDCVMVSPQCALKGGNYGFSTYMRVKLDRCRLIVLNFSQPAGTPTDGIIQSVEQGKFLHVDLNDSTLMGYKVFGVTVNKDTVDELGYTASGATRAYVQYQQDVPEGMLRLGHWPVEVFQDLLPPAPPNPEGRPDMTLSSPIRRDRCEVAPAIWKDRLYLMDSVRPASGGTADQYHLSLRDAETDEELARFAEGYSLACAFVHKDIFYAFASRFENDNWNDVTLFRSTDLKNWEKHLAIKQERNEHLFNSSVCAGPEGFVMAYESNYPEYPAFTIKFATSKDLVTWEKLPGAIFGTNRYTACPAIHYTNGHYYLLYLERRAPLWFFETYIARSENLRDWEYSPRNPVLSPREIDDGINASDPDIIEYNGQTHLYYAVGDQRTWMNIKRAVHDGPMTNFLEAWFPPGLEKLPAR